MEVFEAIFGRRSVRKYTPDSIPDNLIEELIEAARWAPSGGNTQPWRFVVVRDEVTKKMLKAVSPGLSGEPSVIIVVCADFRVLPYEAMQFKIVCALGIGASVQNLLLAAHALGLGACWIASTNFRGVKEAIGLPQNDSIEPISLVSIGYPAENPGPSVRSRIEEITFRETFRDHWSSTQGN